MFELKLLSKEGIPAALERAVRYRLLNEPGEAESICLDVLRIEPDHQQALVILLLAQTDRFGKSYAVGLTQAQEVLPRLRDAYERAYYAGIISERRAKAQEGTWLVTVTIPDGPPPFPGLLNFSAGGALVSTDSATPPTAGNVYQGTWARTGGHKFAFTFMRFNYDSTGVLVGIFRVREHLQIGPSGNAYNGVWTGEVLDPDGNVVVPIGGTSHATRINAE